MDACKKDLQKLKEELNVSDYQNVMLKAQLDEMITAVLDNTDNTAELIRAARNAQKTLNHLSDFEH